MANLASAPRWTIGLLAVLALMCPISSSALAQLTQYIAVNPIDVCAGSGRVCAPINNIGFQGQTVLNGGPNAPIGIIDSDSQINISRAIFNAIGIEVAFGPVQQYISAPNAAYANTDYLTLHVENSTDSAGNPILQSPDFLILSQQQQDPPGIWTGTVPTPTSPPDVPVASQATVLNLFFVNAILPQNGGIAQLYGFGWENNNGMAISMNTLLGVPGSLPFRPDTIAHEFGHNLDLDHTTFGAGPDPNGECDTTPFSGCAVNLMTAGGNEAGDLRAEPRSTGEASSPSPGGALYALMAGTAEQLNATQQVPQVLLSNFIMNNLAESMTTASEMPADNATTAVTDNIGANLTALSGSNADPKSKPNTSIFFNVTGPVPGTDRPGETLDGLILTLNNAVQFDPDNRVRFFPPDNRLVADVDYIHGSKRNPDCPDPATECLVISLSPGLPENQNLTFSTRHRPKIAL
jgi:hypothetical protein